MLKTKKVAAKLKNSKLPLSRHIVILYIAVISLALACVFLGAYSRYLLDNSKNSDTTVLRMLLKDAVEGLYRPASVQPEQHMQYIEEASLRFPIAKQHYDNFRYSYAPASDSFRETIEISSSQAISAGYSQLGTGEKIFENVPQFQRCSKLFAIQFSSEAPDNGYSFEAAGSKQLADGRTAYFFKNNSCDLLYKDMAVDVDTAFATLKQVESY